MNIMRKMAAILFAAAMLIGGTCFTAFASSQEQKTPIYAESLNSGRYEIEVTSSASMFRIVHCELVVSGSDMTAEMTLSGKGYEKLYMGTSEQAEKADESEYIFFTEDADGKYTYTVPVEALDKETDCAAYSFKKQRWYDRKLVFESSLLSGSAFAANEDIVEEETENGAAFTPWLIVIVALCAAGAIAAIVILRFKRK